MKRIIVMIVVVLVFMLLAFCVFSWTAHAAELPATDPTTPCNLTGPEYDKIFTGIGKPAMEGLGETFAQGERETGVNGLFIASIVCLETGYNTSYNAGHRNNMGGITRGGEKGGYRVFDTKEESILFMFKMIADPDKPYFGAGRTTIDQIAPIYCATGGWAKQVKGILKTFLRAMQ
jgi:hypothetical protein